jgi:UMF1 family MFS transporter
MFLIMWFIYSDAFSTLVSIAILFSKEELNAPLPVLLAATLIFPLAAGVGTIFWLWLQKRMNYSTKTMIKLQCGFYALIPVYGLLGFFVDQGTFFGLSNKYELPMVAIFHGFILGATHSSCRVLFSELLPHGHESEFFGLYEVTDKGSSWIGPLASGLIANLTGTLRNAFWFILASFLVPFVLLFFIDVAKGKEQAREFHAKYDALKKRSVDLKPSNYS